MTRKVIITDAVTGKPLRETYVQEEQKFFGMGIRDVVWGIVLLSAITSFMVNSNNLQKSSQETLGRLIDFRDNSDSFQTQIYNTRFVNGYPADPNFKLPNKGFIAKENQ